MSEVKNGCPIHKLTHTSKYTFGGEFITKILELGQGLKNRLKPYKTLEELMTMTYCQSIDELVKVFNAPRKINHSANALKVREQIKTIYTNEDLKSVCTFFYNSILEKKQWSGKFIDQKADQAMKKILRGYTLQHLKGRHSKTVDNFTIFFQSALCEVAFYYYVAQKLNIPHEKIISAIKKITTNTTMTSLVLLSGKNTGYFQCVQYFKEATFSKYNIDNIVRDAFYYDIASNTIVSSLLFGEGGKNLLGTGLCPIIGLTYTDRNKEVKSCYNILFETLEEALDKNSNTKTDISK